MSFKLIPPACVSSKGTSQPCPSLKSLSKKVGSMLCRGSSTSKYKRLDAKLEKKMVEAKRGSSGYQNFKSINSIILKFPQFREGLKNIGSVFEQYGEFQEGPLSLSPFQVMNINFYCKFSLSLIDEDSNGTIDREELKNCLQKLQLHLTEEEVEDLFHSCDIDGSEGIQFNEFIVLLCLIYLLKEPSSNHTVLIINFISVLLFISE